MKRKRLNDKHPLVGRGVSFGCVVGLCGLQHLTPMQQLWNVVEEAVVLTLAKPLRVEQGA